MDRAHARLLWARTYPSLYTALQVRAVADLPALDRAGVEASRRSAEAHLEGFLAGLAYAGLLEVSL